MMATNPISPAAISTFTMPGNKHKKAIHAGRKKGMDMSGMHETGGAAFFTAHLPEGLGDLERMRAATAAAIEGTGDNELAFCLVSNSDTALVVSFVVPPKRADQLGLDEWCATVTEGMGGSVVEDAAGPSVTHRFYVAQQDPANNLFPLKMRDGVMAKSFELLRARKLMVEDDDDGEEFDLGEMYAQNGIEW